MELTATNSTAALAEQVMTMKAAATQQALQIEMLRQQAEGQQGVLALLADAGQAVLPEGQGGAVDVTV